MSASHDRLVSRINQRFRELGGEDRHGRDIVNEARSAHIPVSLACAIVEQETGGRNVFGHDPVKWGQYGYRKNRVVRVTQRRYRRYKRLRRMGFGMQGVGLTQLTWYGLQDDADEMGGCWRPKYQLRVGFRMLSAKMDTMGRTAGIAAYNGSGPAAERYSREVQAKADAWHRLLRHHY